MNIDILGQYIENIADFLKVEDEEIAEALYEYFIENVPQPYENLKETFLQIKQKYNI